MHNRYEEWINNFNACPVLRLDINDYDLMENPEQVEGIIERIGYMLEQTSHLRK